ncbi:HDIG domain-containing protein [soil metagenome]
MSGWWPRKVRRFIRYVTGRVGDAERAGLREWLSTDQMRLFLSMPRADQRHSLDVTSALAAAGHMDRELLLAGLLHDCGKGPMVGLWHRVAWSLGELLGEPVLRICGRLPGFPAAFERITHHAERSAVLALAAGCSSRTAGLIRHQAAPMDPVHGEALRQADETH